MKRIWEVEDINLHFDKEQYVPRCKTRKRKSEEWFNEGLAVETKWFKPMGKKTVVLTNQYLLCVCVCGVSLLVSSVVFLISKAFDRVWHKALLSKLPSCGFYPALSSFLSSFLSGRSIAAIVDGHISTPKPINSGVP